MHPWWAEVYITVICFSLLTICNVFCFYIHSGWFDIFGHHIKQLFQPKVSRVFSGSTERKCETISSSVWGITTPWWSVTRSKPQQRFTRSVTAMSTRAAARRSTCGESLTFTEMLELKPSGTQSCFLTFLRTWLMFVALGFLQVHPWWCDVWRRAER